jgi:hypothetical protein
VVSIDPQGAVIMAEETERSSDEHESSRGVRVWSDNEDTVGAILLGIVTIMLLVAFLRSQKRNRELTAQQKSDE